MTTNSNERDRPPGQGTRRWPDLPVHWEQIFDEAERLSALVGRVLQDNSRLGPAQYQVLAQLERQAPMTLTQLSQALGCTRGNITGVADRLLSQGLIKREPNPGDARSSVVSLTPAGADRLAEARKALQALAAGDEGTASDEEAANSMVRREGGQYVLLSANRRPGTGQEMIILRNQERRARRPGGAEQDGIAQKPGSGRANGA